MVGFLFKVLQRERWNCSFPTEAALRGLASGVGLLLSWEVDSMGNQLC